MLIRSFLQHFFHLHLPVSFFFLFAIESCIAQRSPQMPPQLLSPLCLDWKIHSFLKKKVCVKYIFLLNEIKLLGIKLSSLRASLLNEIFSPNQRKHVATGGERNLNKLKVALKSQTLLVLPPSSCKSSPRTPDGRQTLGRQAAREDAWP